MEAAENAIHKDSLELVEISSEADVVIARQRIRDVARELGFSAVDQTLIATAVSEVARNILEYAEHGMIRYGPAEDPSREGIIIIAEDEGPGISNIELALQDGFSTRASLGMGLPGARRLVDDFRIESSPGKGTTVILRKWNLS